MSVIIAKHTLCDTLTFTQYGISFFDIFYTARVCRYTTDVNSWLAYVTQSYPLTIALDIKYDNQNRPAILQLCARRICLAIQLNFANEIPNSLRDILNNPKCEVLGHGIENHVETLFRVYGLKIRNPVDVGDFAADSIQIESLRSADLGRIVKEVLGIEIEKWDEEKSGNWGDEVLTEDQIKYGAIDVIVLVEMKDYHGFRRFMEGPQINDYSILKRKFK